ncbi:MAG: hypothetical protein QMD71_05925 [bacterium]|nr:hypothetical protein [bacterium]
MLLYSIIFVLYIHNPDLWTYFGDFRFVNSIICDNRFVYVASDYGITRFDKLTSSWTPPKSRTPFPNNVKLIAQDPFTNEIWFVIPEALGRYNTIFEDYRLIEFPEGYTTPCSIAISKDYVYLSASGGLHQYLRLDKLTKSWTNIESLPQELEWFPEVSPYQYPWLAPYYVLDKFLSRYDMTCAATDGRWVWVGTAGDGLYKYDATTYMPEHYLLGVPARNLTSLWGDGEDIWIGTEQGVIRYNHITNLYTYYSPSVPDLCISAGLPTNVTSIIGNDKSVWVGTLAGLYQFDKHSGNWHAFTKFGVGAIHELPLPKVTSLTLNKETIWIGTEDGLSKFENGVIKEIFKGLPVNDIKLDSHDSLWIATSKGVFCKSGSSWSQFDDPDKIMPHGVYKILFHDNVIYFGSKQGILVYENGVWQRFTYPVYLPGEQILSMVADSVNGISELWIGTDSGVAVWDKSHNLWERYTQENSPIKGEVYSIFLGHEYIYFGTGVGLVGLKKE